MNTSHMNPDLKETHTRSRRRTSRRPLKRRFKSRRLLFQPLEDRRLLALTINPTGPEQETLELINRMREDPAAELGRLIDLPATDPATSSDTDVNSDLAFFGVKGTALVTQWTSLTAKAPLAWNETLYNAARAQSQFNIDNDMQAHSDLSFGGYSGSKGENVFAAAKSVFYSHAGFAIDWGTPDTDGDGIQDAMGHRDNIMGDYREVGIGILTSIPGGNTTATGPLVVTHAFGDPTTSGDPYLFGVAFTDGNSDTFYTSGEGNSGVLVTVEGVGGTPTPSMNTDTTKDAGAYQFQVPPGNYKVTFSGGGLPTPLVVENVAVVANTNAKVDSTDATAATVAALAIAATDADKVEGDAGNTAFTFTVTRTGDTTAETMVNYAVTGSGTNAADATDFGGTLPSDTVTFPANDTNPQVITINVSGDTDVEPDEGFTVTLSGATGGATIPTPAASGTIQNDDDCSTTVTNTNDSGDGSLREAILCSNLAPGVQTIDFAISGSGPHTIQPSTALPTITDPVVIDGTTQTGFTTTPVVELDGSNIAGDANGLKITAGGSTVRGIAINRFSAAGIVLRDAGGNTLEGIFVGTNVTGDADLGNGGNGLVIVDSGSNMIGGTTGGARNVFSGNSHMGIVISGVSSTNNMIVNNAIGSDVAGMLPLANDRHGVVIFGAADNIVGAATDNAGNTISGNVLNGVYIAGTGATGNALLGNYVGVKSNGTEALANGRNGVELRAEQNVVGGLATSEGNTISGNVHDGVKLVGSAAINNRVEGNGIGTDKAQTSAVPNGRHGVLLSGAPNNMIEGNTISGNTLGVLIFGPGATGNRLMANRIGTDAAGTADIGNSLNGVDIFNASGSTIGGTTAGDGNTIAFNNRGVRVASGTGNAIESNSIFSNDRLGIDLGGNGRTANDGDDPDTGPNNLQNFPEFGPVILQGTNLQIEYSVPSAATATAFPLRVEFFLADASNQEGRTLVGTDNYTSVGTKQITIPAGAATAADRILATGTDADGNTSEFSISRSIVAAATAAAAPRLLAELATVDAVFAQLAADEV